MLNREQENEAFKEYFADALSAEYEKLLNPFKKGNKEFLNKKLLLII